MVSEVRESSPARPDASFREMTGVLPFLSTNVSGSRIGRGKKLDP